ncbi:uncharacterized protein LOC113520587 [Galleria mellonella]|uniref:Uncharacterized protein LOC113520587 n=1 Tax=Galleria mellonella TaxID=7137 RepID=A0A6J1X6A8_GALME|nr:uncharacterized protein LOC113520587 [Galleria mellonella]
MARGTLFLLAFCALAAAAMVSRERRAVNTEDQQEPISTTTQRLICEPQTPCAWSIYKPGLKYLTQNLTNSYCVCSADTVCQVNEDDTSVNAYIHRCRPPPTEEEEYESDR